MLQFVILISCLVFAGIVLKTVVAHMPRVKDVEFSIISWKSFTLLRFKASSNSKDSRT